MVADTMLSHPCNLPIQSIGCVILDNLAIDKSSQSGELITDLVVDALLREMLHHPRSLDVHKAA
jgi:hypothetical protein